MDGSIPCPTLFQAERPVMAKARRPYVLSQCPRGTGSRCGSAERRCLWPDSRNLWIKLKIATLTFKALNTGNPPYLASMLHQHNPCRSLRSASANLLSVTRCNLSFGTRGLHTAAPTIWNSLPPNVCSCKSLATFRKYLKSHLFQSSSPTA